MDTIVCVVCETEFPEEGMTQKCPKCGADHGYDEGVQVMLGPVINYDLEKGEVTFQIKRGG